MVRQPQPNYPVRLDALTHARLKLASEQSKPQSTMNAIAIHAITIYLEQHFPEIISSVTAALGSETPAETEGAKPKARKPRKK
jgi:hypothetical protein